MSIPPGKKFGIVAEMMSKPDNRMNVKELCAIAGVSRSGY